MIKWIVHSTLNFSLFFLEKHVILVNRWFMGEIRVSKPDELVGLVDFHVLFHCFTSLLEFIPLRSILTLYEDNFLIVVYH